MEPQAVQTPVSDRLASGEIDAKRVAEGDPDDAQQLPRRQGRHS
jgi:hypothetical protein